MNYSVIAEKFGITKTRTESIIKAAMSQVVDEVMEFGKCWVGRDAYFRKVDKPERSFRNPRTGEEGMAPAKTFVVMKKRMAV